LRGLETTCEVGANKFLRGDDCIGEVAEAKCQLSSVLDLLKEFTEGMAREKREGFEHASDVGELGNIIDTRRVPDGSNGEVPTLEAAKPQVDSEVAIEVDGTIEADEVPGSDAEMPKLQYRSTRALR
ncbi:hypothetical protein EDB80DRAFT_553096, partial [Ilyonectria destructans]